SGTVQRDADAGRDRDLPAGHGEGLTETLEETLRHHDGVVLVAQVFEKYGELVASESRHGVRRTEATAHALGDGAQQLVAGGVPEAVVDVLEPVEVHEI